MCKAPLVPEGAPVVNALFRQRAAIENVMRACLGLGPCHHMQLEHRLDLNLLTANGHMNGGEPPIKKQRPQNNSIKM